MWTARVTLAEVREGAIALGVGQHDVSLYVGVEGVGLSPLHLYPS